MPNILQVAVPNGSAAIAWNGRSATPSINSLLLMNADLNNTIYVGNDPSITANTGARIPIQPNGSLSVDPTSSWYVVGAASGIAPMVMVPNGQAYFLGITAGLGNLVIPSVQSPNFLSGLTGWQIAKDGSAQFNNLTIRGTFFGLDFIINNTGAFFYNGAPALGNLKVSIVSNGGGTDTFGNVYKDNVTCYNTAVAGGGYAQLAANPTTGSPYLVLSPPNVTHQSAPPQIAGGVGNAGLVNEYEFLELFSGDEVSSGVGSQILLYSRSNDSTLASAISMSADEASITLQDGNSYNFGQLDLQGTALPQTINSTTAQTVTGCTANATPGGYKIEAEIVFTGSAAGAGNPSFQIGCNATTSKFWGSAIIWQTTGAGAGANRFDVDTSGMNFQGPAMVAAAVYLVKIKGYVTCTTSGGFSLQAFTSAVADSFVINEAALTITPIF